MTTQNGRTEHFTHTLETTDVKYKTFRMGILHVPQIVTVQQLQHCAPYKHGLFKVYNSKYPA